MLRRNALLRKQYLYRKSVEEKDSALTDRKRQLRDVIDTGKVLPSENREDFKRLKGQLDLDDNQTAQHTHTSIDDEYAFAGVKDPRILITTSRSPSSRLLQFAKEIKLLLPNSERVNRGGYKLKDLIDVSHRNDVSDIVIVHEHKGEPDGMIVCHLPHGPTAYFGLSDVSLRHDLPSEMPSMSESAPHLVLHNFTTKLGQRVQNVLKFLFPPSSENGQRVVCLINYGDMILLRNYVWKTIKTVRGENPKVQNLELDEQGPRFTLRLYRLDLGTLDMKDVQTEWALRAFINKPAPAIGVE